MATHGQQVASLGWILPLFFFYCCHCILAPPPTAGEGECDRNHTLLGPAKVSGESGRTETIQVTALLKSAGIKEYYRLEETCCHSKFTKKLGKLGVKNLHRLKIIIDTKVNKLYNAYNE